MIAWLTPGKLLIHYHSDFLHHFDESADVFGPSIAQYKAYANLINSGFSVIYDHNHDHGHMLIAL